MPWIADKFPGLYDWYRKHFGTYELVDPRPIQAEAPYTYYLPEAHVIAAILPGDLVKLTFHGKPEGREWDSERMWVEVIQIESDSLTGLLRNDPDDMPQLKEDDVVVFHPFHVIDILREDPEKPTLPENETLSQQYWDRCLVDTCVLEDGVPVEYIYREEPDLSEEGDKFPDGGWRIRGDARGISDKEMESRDFQYIALGKVLNADDSWLHLIDEPVGSRFMRNFDTGEYEKCEEE